MNEPTKSHIEVPASSIDVPIKQRARVSLRALAASVCGLLILFTLSLVVPYGLQTWFKSGRPEGSPSAAEMPTATFPQTAPQLSTEQRVQREAYQAAERQLLDSYEWTDRKAGIARIPIDRAMQIIAQQNRQTEKP